MNKVKMLFTIIISVAAVMLIHADVFAYTGNGSKNTPFMVTTFEELQTCIYDGGYIMLANNIEVTDPNPSFAPKYYLRADNTKKKTLLDLNGYTLKVNSTSEVSLCVVEKDVEFYLYNKNNGKIIFNTNSRDASGFDVYGSFYMNNGVLSCSQTCIYVRSKCGYASINGAALVKSQSGYAVYSAQNVSIKGGTLKSEKKYALFLQAIYSGAYDYVSRLLFMDGGEIYGIEYDDPNYPDKLIQGYIKEGKVYYGIKTDNDSSCCFLNYDYVVAVANGKTFSKGTYIDNIHADIFEFKRTDNITSIQNVTLNGDFIPVAGKAPVIPTAPEGSNYTVDAHWSVEGSNNEVTKFDSGQTYTLRVTLTPDSGYDFNSGIELADIDINYDLNFVSRSQDGKVIIDYTFDVDIKPCISQQPKPDVYVTLNKPTTVSVTSSNTDSYKWYIERRRRVYVDQYEWDMVSDMIKAEGTDTSTLTITPLSVNADEYRVYCILTNENGATKSDFGVIHFTDPVISFDANGGSGTMSKISVPIGEKVTLPDCAFTPPQGDKSGEYVFDGWYTTINGITKYDETAPVLNNVTVYAKWIFNINKVEKQVTSPAVGETPDINGYSTYHLNYDGEYEKFDDHSYVQYVEWKLSSDAVTKFEAYKPYRAKLYIYKDNSIKNSRFTQDTKFYVNGNEAKIESVSDTMAVVYYDFDAIKYSTIPFDMENTDTSIGGTLMLDGSVIENMIMEDDSLMESYFDDDYYFVWYNKYGDIIAKINGSGGSSLKVDASMAETTVYAELKIAGETISSKKIEIPAIVIKGDVDQNKTVNDIDAEYLLKYLCGSITLNEAQLK